MRTFFFSGLIWFLGVTNAFSITLADAVLKAQKNSDQAMIIQETRHRFDAEARKVTAFTLPQFNATASWLRMGTTEDIETGIPALDQEINPPDRQISARLEVSQVLWSGGRIQNSYGLKNELLILSKLQENSRKAALYRQVSHAFLACLYQQERLAVLNDRVAQRKDELQNATDLFDAGMVTRLDVREAQLNYHVAEDDLHAGKSNFHDTLVDFNLVIGRSIKRDLLKPEGSLTRPHSLEVKLSDLETRLRNRTQLDLKIVSHQLETSRRNLKMARGEKWPSLLLVGGGDYSGDDGSAMDTSWNVGVQLKWNLYDGGTIAAKKAAARANMHISQSTLHQKEKNLQGLLDKLRTGVDSLNQRIQYQEKTVTLSHENYEDARGMYGQGSITLTRLGEFNLLFAEARFNLLRLYYLENRVSLDLDALLQ